MSVNRIYDNGPITVNGAAFTLRGILSANTDPGLTEIMQSAAGQVDPSFVATMNNIPVQSAVVTDLATLLANMGFDGLDFRSGGTYISVQKFFVQTDEGGTRKGTLSHFRVTMNEGIGIFTTIDSRINEPAQASVEFHPTFDGTNDPYEYAANVSLPPASNQINELFTLGGVKVNGVQIDSMQGVSIDSGIELFKKISDGVVFPTFVTIMSRKPRITINTDDVDLLSTLGISGTPQSVTDSVVFLRKMDENGTRVADGTAEHISFTVDDGLIWAEGFGGSNNAAQEGTIVIQPTFDGTNAIVVTSTTAIITGIT